MNFRNDNILKNLEHNTFIKCTSLDFSSLSLSPGSFIKKLCLSNKGITLKTFKQILDNRTCLENYIKYLGLVDTWISISSLHIDNNNTNDNTKDNANNNNIKWNLPEYISNDKPIINLEEFKNIAVNNSVSNNIQIGGNNTQNKNLMITGPNASGKSTFLKGITETLIFGQTICLVPANKMSFTPFTEINTYLNIPDCQGKESLFQAEMERCFQQIQNIKTLPKNKFVFSIMDEIFVSTNYYEGISGAYAISEKMGRFNNSICIISTHFPTLSKFCQRKGHYTNYHFTIQEIEDPKTKIKKIHKTYKIIKGESKKHIALKMLEEKD